MEGNTTCPFTSKMMVRPDWPQPLGVTGFNRLTALSNRNDSPTTASRPFSATRDGFVLGEGAAIVILETLESAQKRGVSILAEIIGFGSSNDAFRVTDMHEDARGATQALRAAKNVPCSSAKSQLGHLIGAAGCAELITCIKAIEENMLPMTMNLNDPDPALDLDYVPNKPRPKEVNIAINESFGFGGQNNVLVIRRFTK